MVVRLLVLWLGKLVQLASRASGRGGSALPGLVVERIRPRLLSDQVARLPRGTVLVTGTNGKTTTVKMLTTMLEGSGLRVLTNRTGSNMVRGLLSTVIEHSSWGGRLRADMAVFEVDEPNVPAAAAATGPGLVLVLNLHRDQLDRYGELERTAELIGEGLMEVPTVLLNRDDSLVARLAEAVPTGRVRWFGAAPIVRDRLPDDAALLLGPRDREPLRTDDLTAELLAVEELTDHQELHLRVATDDLEADLALPGVYNAYNAAAALGAAVVLGIEAEGAAASLARVRPAFGRGERITLDDSSLILLLVKNPSSFTQAIHTQLRDGPARSILFAINDNFADGRDVSWLWDVDFEALAGRGDRILVSGIRADDLALRLKYADIPSDVEPDLERALARFRDGLQAGEVGFVLPTYTAMLDLRRRLEAQAELEEVWR